MALLQALVIGLVALILAPGFLFYFDVTPKLVVLLAGAAAALLWPRPMRAPRLFSALVVAGLASLALSAALSSRPALSLFGTNWRRFGVVEQAAVLLFAWTVAARPESARAILRAVAVAGGLSAAYGIAQYFGWDPILPAGSYRIGEGIWTIVRPPGTLGYVSYFATWLLFVAFLSMALAAMEESRAWRSIAYTAAAVATIAMFLTGTRAAVVGLLAGLAVWMWARGFRVPRRWIAIAALVIAAGAAFYFSPPGAQLRSRTRWFVEDPTGGARPKLWRDSLAMALHRPLAGFGPETFTAQFPHYESPTLARAYPDFAHESPHNIFLDALVSQGVPGLLVLVAFCAAGLWTARHSPWLAAALAAAIVAQQFTVFTIPNALIFYTTIALAMRPSESQPARGRLILGILALLFLYFATRFALSGHSLELARRDLNAGDLQAASAAFDRYQHQRLPGTTSDLWYSRATLAFAQKSSNPVLRMQATAQSGAAALAATKTAEEPFNAWYQIAMLYATQNDAGGTERSLRSAIAANPNWFKPHWTLAQLLLLQRRIPEAEHEATLAAELNGDKNPEVARTLAEVKSCCK
jgi:O-antigen ligase